MLRAVLAEKNVTWPQVPQPGREGEIFKKFRVGALPTYSLLDPEGKIVSRVVRGPGLEEELQRLLGPAR